MYEFFDTHIQINTFLNKSEYINQITIIQLFSMSNSFIVQNSVKDGKTHFKICLAFEMPKRFLPKTMNDGYVFAETKETFLTGEQPTLW